MGVYIKNFELPKSGYVSIDFHSDGTAYDYSHDKHYEIDVFSDSEVAYKRLIDADSFREWILKQKRLSKHYILMILDEMSEHSAVGVPVPHGRLVDADVNRDDFMAVVYEELSDEPDNYKANRIIEAFDSMPSMDEQEE